MTEERRIDRYVLEDLISSNGTIHVWRGWDPSLDRAVTVLLLPADDSRAEEVSAAARRAATVDERRLVSVLDVIDSATLMAADQPSEQLDTGGSTAYLAIVSEWVEGRTLTDIQEEREGEPIDATESLAMIRQVAIALLHGHEAGVPHGRLRPGSLIIAESADLSDPFSLLGDINVVRVRGLAVDAALWPAEDATDEPGASDAPAGDPDVHGTGCLLYAMVTGRWPEGLVDGMSPAPRVNGRLLPPSQVVAAVPAAIDDICMRAIGPRTTGEWPPKRGRTPYADMSSLVAALGVSTENSSLDTMRRPTVSFRRDPSQPLTFGRRVVRFTARLAVAAVAIVLVGGLGLMGMRIAGSAASPWGVEPDAVPTEVLTATEGVGSGSARLDPGALEGLIPIASAIDYDPFGTDKTESPETAPGAVDMRSDTAWTTESYSAADLDGKPGVGLVIDIGSAQPISAVRLELNGAGSSLIVGVASEILKKPKKWPVLAQADSIGTAIDLRAPRPVVGQYILVWFTQLPPQDGAYQAGVRDVQIFR